MRVNMDSSIVSDPRFKLVAQALKVKWTEVIGSCFLVWLACYDRRSTCLRKVEADLAAEISGFSKALIDENLADEMGDGVVRIHGVEERIKFLLKQAESGAKGGKSKGKKQTPTRKQAPAQAPAYQSAQANTPSPSPDLTPDLDPSHTPSDARADGGDSFQQASDVLAFLNRRASTKHSPMSTETMKPILARLRGEEGEPAATPWDLELIIDHRCALWLGSERAIYLRPKTLFGAEHFADYLQFAEQWDSQGRPDPNAAAKPRDRAQEMWDRSEDMRREEEAAEAAEADQATEGQF